MKKYRFKLPSGENAVLVAIDAKTISESTRFFILSGGFYSENDALLAGTTMKNSLLCFAVKCRIGIDLGKNKASCFLGDSIREAQFRESGIRLEPDVHGLSVYSEEHPISYVFSPRMNSIRNAKDCSLFSNEICSLFSSGKKISNKVLLAMELVTASFFETSSRSKFLTLVLAAEAILVIDSKNEKVKAVVKELISVVRSTELSESEQNSIAGSLKWLKKDSISLSLKKMAIEYLSEKQYNGVDSHIFIKECYDARSKLVHEGGVDESKYNISRLASAMEVYMSDMLLAIIE
ncbi:HEPN domain-containing protein [Psychromonas sp. SA13A]|uniref:HEPN domain-containing protein n=1 Tax=Psychromonas sp. SA13A TaxID=2686346 RepID=UPI00140C444A